MRQLLQSYRTGELSLVEAPAPSVGRGGVVVRTRVSAISAGTETQMMQLAKQSLLGKARARPDLVRRVIQKIRTEGLLAAAHAVRTKLNVPVTMGYSCAGRVLEVGADVSDLHVGQRVACAGVGYATHSDVNFVPRRLVTPIPEGVSDEDASFVALGAIAMQGLRKADVQLGEVVAVVGLGLVGQILVQLLLAAGCRVIGADPDRDRRARAAARGITAVEPADLETAVIEATGGHGADCVMITASTPSNQVMIQSAQLARLRGRVVVIGFVGMDFPQQPFYRKELEIVFSMSYGPGRYDPDYEERGHDYPYSLVRWTEGRNMAAVLDLVAQGKLRFSDLVTHRFAIDRALEAYQMLDRGQEPHLAMVLTYDDQRSPEQTSRVTVHDRPASGPVRIGLIGAGDYARSTLLPAIKAAGPALVGVASATGRSAADLARQHGFGYAAGDYRQLLADASINAIVIATRHDQHAPLVVEALAAGKHVLVEKPLCLSLDELARIEAAYTRTGGSLLLHVGHNRRFSPAVEAARSFFGSRSSPMVVHYRVNTGPMDPDHWHRQPDEGGGRWLGEGSHFVDLAVAMIGTPPQRVFATRTVASPRRQRGESWNVTLTFADASVANVTYCDLGDRALPKERCEIFADGKAVVIEDFSRLEQFAAGRRRVVKLAHDKGHRRQLQRFVAAVRDGGRPIVPFDEQAAVARATLLADLSHRRGASLTMDAAADCQGEPDADDSLPSSADRAEAPVS